METPPQPPAEVVAEHVHALETAQPHGYLEHEIQKHGKAPNLHLKEPRHQEAPPPQVRAERRAPALGRLAMTSTGTSVHHPRLGLPCQACRLPLMPRCRSRTLIKWLSGCMS